MRFICKQRAHEAQVEFEGVASYFMTGLFVSYLVWSQQFDLLEFGGL